MAGIELNKWRLFADLTTKEIQVIVDACEVRLLMAGEDLFHEGDSDDAMWIIQAGRVEIYKHIRGDIDRSLASFGVGNVIGEMGFIDRSQRSAGARTTEPSEFLVLSSAAFAQVQSDHPEIAAGLYRNLSSILAERLRATNELYRESVAFALEAIGAGQLNLLALSEELRPVQVHLAGGSSVTGRILQLDNGAIGYTLVLKDSAGKLVIIPYHAVQRIEVA